MNDVGRKMKERATESLSVLSSPARCYRFRVGMAGYFYNVCLNVSVTGEQSARALC